jgi:alkylation response protein AidB-like acyl-CoA dehydrogenase
MQADVVLVTVKTDPEAGAKGITCFLYHSVYQVSQGHVFKIWEAYLFQSGP